MNWTASCSAGASTSSNTDTHYATSTSTLDVALVRELLESAERRHRQISKQVAEFGDDPDPHAVQHPVKDARRHNFALEPVALVSSNLRKASASSSVDRVTTAGEQTPANGGSTSSDPIADSEAVWRSQLQLHVVHLLQRLRARPELLRARPKLLRDFLLVKYEDEREVSGGRWASITQTRQSEEESGGDDGDENASAGGGDGDASDLATRHDSVLERLQRHERVHKKRMGKNYAKLRFVFSQLHHAAIAMGEQLYERVRSMVRRSVASGVLSQQANGVRLASIYKLELRRQVTVEKLLDAVKTQDAERRRKKQRKKRDEQHVRAQTLRRQSGLLSVQGNGNGVATEPIDSSALPPTHADANTNASQQYEHFGDYHHIETESTKSAHFFKMHALERVLAAEQRHRGSVFQRQNSSVATSGGPQRLVSEQTEELIHEKLMASVYSRSRDTFPVWKEPPESAFSRDETLRQLKRLLPVLMAMPLFAGLSIEQLLEFARATKWRTHVRGATVIETGASMDELVVVLDGKLDVLPHQLSSSASKAELNRAMGAGDRADELTDTSGSTVAQPLELISRAISTCFGELGMLSKTEVWTTTLFAQSVTVKTLVISRAAFDSVLQRLFGGGFKSRQALVSAHQQRPAPSPATGGVRGLATLSPTRPLTAAATTVPGDRNVTTAASRQQETHVDSIQAGQKQTEPTPAALKLSKHTSTGAEDSRTTPSTESPQSRTVDATAATPRRPPSRNAVQHYPRFDAPTRAGSSSGATFAHMFQLKWAKPIAFPMESLDALAATEWAPPLPDTSAMVDFLSPESLSSARLLFERTSVLVKENLRSVCSHHHHQIFSSTSRRPTLAADSSVSDAGGNSSGRADSSTTPGPFYAATNTAVVAESGGENGPMTLAQFTEGRQRFGNRSGSKRRLSVSLSMQNLLASPTATSSATVMKLSRMPFSRSSFASETSFYPDRRVRLSTNNEDDDTDDDDDDDDISERTSDDVAQLRDDPSDGRPSAHDLSSPAHDAHTSQAPTEPSGDSRHEDSDHTPTTRARKMALDSLLSTVAANSQRKSQLLDASTAQAIIVNKYLRATDASEAKALPRPIRSAVRLAKIEPHESPPLLNGINASVPNAHAPLPLRVELQRRMDAVLVGLRLKPKAKLELVLKYTHADHYDRFQIAVVLWEQALHYITKREAALASLRQFELVASDPRRHFRSLSTHRLTEQKQRDALFHELHYTTDVCREALAELSKQCGDTVWFDDRVYTEKMKKDYTELLFDVEQERLEMIYGGVRPSVASGDDDRRELMDSRAKALAVWPETLSYGRKRIEDSRETLCSPPTVEDCSSLSSSNNVEDDARELSVVAGSTAIGGGRHRLANPQESIYVNIAEKRELEERRAALEVLQQDADEKETHERWSSVTATHSLTLQVKLQRQAELDELTQRLKMKNRTAAPRDSNTSQRDFVSELDEVRLATTTVPHGSKSRSGRPPSSSSSPAPAAPSDLALLQRALHRFIHRPKD